jgi:hypothetical protein
MCLFCVAQLCGFFFLWLAIAAFTADVIVQATGLPTRATASGEIRERGRSSCAFVNDEPSNSSAGSRRGNSKHVNRVHHQRLPAG